VKHPLFQRIGLDDEARAALLKLKRNLEEPKAGDQKKSESTTIHVNAVHHNPRSSSS
jgi:hypothetical protein